MTHCIIRWRRRGSFSNYYRQNSSGLQAIIYCTSHGFPVHFPPSLSATRIYCHTMPWSIMAYNRIRPPPRRRRRRDGVDTNKQYLHCVRCTKRARRGIVVAVLFCLEPVTNYYRFRGTRVEDADSASLQVNRGKLLYLPTITRPFPTRARRG